MLIIQFFEICTLPALNMALSSASKAMLVSTSQHCIEFRIIFDHTVTNTFQRRTQFDDEALFINRNQGCIVEELTRPSLSNNFPSPHCLRRSRFNHFSTNSHPIKQRACRSFQKDLHRPVQEAGTAGLIGTGTDPVRSDAAARFLAGGIDPGPDVKLREPHLARNEPIVNLPQEPGNLHLLR